MGYFAIVAYDQLFQGLYGFYHMSVEECRDEEEARCIGKSMSRSIIDSNESIYNALEKQITKGIENFPELDEQTIADIMYKNDIAYEYYQLDESKLPTLDTFELTLLYTLDKINFIQKYSIKE